MAQKIIEIIEKFEKRLEKLNTELTDPASGPVESIKSVRIT